MGSLPFRVCEKPCDTCVFSPNRPVEPDRLRDLIESYGPYGHQICHKFGVGQMPDESQDPNETELDGEDVWCRGFLDRIDKLQGPQAKEFMDKMRDEGLLVDVPLSEAIHDWGKPS